MFQRVFGSFIFYLWIGFCPQTSLYANASGHPYVLGSGEIIDVAYSPDGQYIAAIGSLGVQILNRDSLEVVRAYLKILSMNELKWSPNSQSLFVTDMRNIYGSYVINIENNSITEIGTEIHWQFSYSEDMNLQIPDHNNSINFSANSKELVVVAKNNQIEIYNASHGGLIESIDVIDANDNAEESNIIA
ncbi:MAG: hypothetical protein ACP5D6_11345 [Kosmotogaceae bacterium]